MKRPNEEDLSIMDKVLVFVANNRAMYGVDDSFLNATGIELDSDIHQVYKDLIIEFNNSEEKICQPMSEGSSYQDIECNVYTDRFIKSYGSFIQYFDKTQPIKRKHESKYENDINAKLEEILQKLDRTEAGHEVIFNELQELRGFITVINKKNFAQLLKGKLLDLMLNKAIAFGLVDANEIFTKIVGESINMFLK